MLPIGSVGDRVAVQSNLFCGHCEFCARGEESLCLNGELLGMQRDGGFAERVAVPASALVRLPEKVDFATAAALTLAGSTAMHMLTCRTQVRPGDWVLAIGGSERRGFGGDPNCQTIGRARHQHRFHRGQAAFCGGAWARISWWTRASADWPAEVRKITQKRGVDLVVEHVGRRSAAAMFHCLARGGTVVTCGATSGREVPLNLWPFFVKEQKLVGSYGRNRKDIIATLDWAAEGKIKPVIHKVYPLSGTGEAYAALRQRAVMGKAVIEP